jgi:hypothetical protein
MENRLAENEADIKIQSPLNRNIIAQMQNPTGITKRI